jgi:formate dehydrogenase subunit gamma
VVAASTYVLLFPFAVTDIAGIISHIYIGSIGMEGAFDAMGSGQVDVNWAREHHSLWLEEELRKGNAAGKPPTVGRQLPAE